MKWGELYFEHLDLREPLEPGLPFVQTINRRARAQGLGAFKVFVDGKEIEEPHQAPQVVGPGLIVVIRPYGALG